MKRRNSWVYYFVITVLAAFLSACSGIRHLPEGEQLYIGTRKIRFEKRKTDSTSKKIKLKNRANKKVDLLITTWVPPNGALFGFPNFRFFPYRLILYNWFYTEREKGFRKWMMDNFGEPPITISQVAPYARMEKMKTELFAQGHFNADGEVRIVNKRNARKAKIHYILYPGPSWEVSKVDYEPFAANEEVTEIYKLHLEENEIEVGKEFNLYQIEKEKNRLLRRFHNSGFLYLTEEDLQVLGDTTIESGKVALRYRIDKNINPNKLLKGEISSLTVTFNDLPKTTEATTDSNIQLKGDTAVLNRKMLSRAILFKPHDTYRIDEREGSVKNLSSMNIFSGINLYYSPTEGDSSLVNANMVLSTADQFNVGLDGAVTTKSNSYLGPSIGVKLEHKNVFNGAQNMVYGLDAFYDFPTGSFRQELSNSYGLGASVSMNYPIRRNPLGFLKKRKNILPKGALDFSISYNDRPDFFKLLNFNTVFGLAWKPGKHISHRFNYISTTYTNLIETSATFDDLVDDNAQLRQSFQERFFLGPSYALIFNNISKLWRRHSLYYRFDAEFSGNILSGIQRLSGFEESRFLGETYAQFTRLQSDLRYYLRTGVNSQLAFRWKIGLGIPLGKTEVMPYITQFFIGGTNSMRPFAPRVVGPGTYDPGISTSVSNLNKTGDLQLEWNIEYRFNLIYRLKGALWSDIGNIFITSPDSTRPGGEFDFNTFYEKLIITAGIGLRLDLEFLILRWDIGTLMYTPWEPQRNRWIWENGMIPVDYVIGIGYPF